MVLFHFVFNLRFFFGFRQVNVFEGFWFYEGRVAAVIFIVLVGVISSLIAQVNTPAAADRKNSIRGLRLLGLGLTITLITLILTPQGTVWFGILHFLGLSILIGIPLGRFRKLNLVFAAILFAAYYPMQNLNASGYTGIIFGVLPSHFSSLDHYALIPWLGFVLIGLSLGNWFYPEGKPLIKRAPTLPEKWLAIAGKRSLWIYFIHQPVLLGLTWLYLQFAR
jgi:uncharacterized membrane protein